MKINQVSSYIFFSKITLTDSTDKGEARVTAYGPILAKIVSVLRTIGWVITAGYYFKEAHIPILYQGSNYYLHPDQIQSARIKLGECEKGEPVIDPSTVGKIITNVIVRKGKLLPLNSESCAILEREGLHIKRQLAETPCWINAQIIEKLPKENAYYLSMNSSERWVSHIVDDQFVEWSERYKDKKIIILSCFAVITDFIGPLSSPDKATSSLWIRSYKPHSVATCTFPVWFFCTPPTFRELSKEEEEYNLKVLEEGLRVNREKNLGRSEREN